jgi:hypothetical protein
MVGGKFRSAKPSQAHTKTSLSYAIYPSRHYETSKADVRIEWNSQRPAQESKLKSRPSGQVK